MTQILGHIPLAGDWASQREFFAALSPSQARQYAAHRNAAAKGERPRSVISKAEPKAGVPDPPVVTGARAGDGQVTVYFTPPANNGGSEIRSYQAWTKCGHTATGPSSPITIPGLNNDQPYDCFVIATNANGDSHPSLQVAQAMPAAANWSNFHAGKRQPLSTPESAASWTRAFNRIRRNA
jgi:hypothetical protein